MLSVLLMQNNNECLYSTYYTNCSVLFCSMYSCVFVKQGYLLQHPLFGVEAAALSFLQMGSQTNALHLIRVFCFHLQELESGFHI